MASAFDPRRDPQDPTSPSSGYPGGAVGPLYGPQVNPEFGTVGPGKPRAPDGPDLSDPVFAPWKAHARESSIARVFARVVGWAIDQRWLRDRLQVYTEETRRQFLTPVAAQPWHVPPFNSHPIGGVVRTNIAAGASIATVVSASVPLGYWGVIRWVGHDTQNDASALGVDAWDDLTWTIAVGRGTNLIAVPSYDAFQAQIGQVEAPSEHYIFVPGGQTVAFRVANGNVGQAYDVTALLRGWAWKIRGGQLDGSAKGVMGD